MNKLEHKTAWIVFGLLHVANKLITIFPKLGDISYMKRDNDANLFI